MGVKGVKVEKFNPLAKSLTILTTEKNTWCQKVAAESGFGGLETPHVAVCR